jgi:hypothetical protein
LPLQQASPSNVPQKSLVIAVETHVRRLDGHHRAHHLGLEGMRREREESWLLLCEDLDDGPLGLVGMWMGDVAAPAAELGVQVARRPAGRMSPMRP